MSELVGRIVKEVDIMGLIRGCGIKSGRDDLYQYLVLSLCESASLERVYSGGYIVPFIIRMILNQRNNSSSMYNRYYRVLDGVGVDVSDVEYDGGRDVLMDYLNMEIRLYGSDMEYIMKKCILIMVRSGSSLRRIGREMGLSKSFITKHVGEMRKELWTKLMVLYLYEKSVERGMKELEFIRYWKERVLGQVYGVDELNEAYYLLEGVYPESNCGGCVQDRLVYLQNKFSLLIRVPSVMEEYRRYMDGRVLRKKKK